MKQHNKSLLTSLTLLALCASLSGCFLFKAPGPNAQVNIQSAQYLNPDINGQTSPVVVTIYQLKSPYSFEQASYNTLAANSSQALGTDLIDKNTFEVRPNSHQQVKQSISPSTQYLGIVAAYRNIDQAKWRQVIKVKNEKGKHTIINLVLESEALAASAHYSGVSFRL